MGRRNVSLFVFVLALAGCQTTPRSKWDPGEPYSSASCRAIARALPDRDGVAVLDGLTGLFERGCYREVTTIGARVQPAFQDKSYSLSAEVGEIFLPDGALTRYVMESYERAYLSFLIAVSHERLRRFEDTEVAMRRAYSEGRALIYNYGEDPPNLLLQAALWDRKTGSDVSRPFWLRLSRHPSTSETLREFAERRLGSIDAGESRAPRWRLYALGRFPEVDWHMSFRKTGNGYFRFEPKREFELGCKSESGLVVSTRPWFEKLSTRYSSDYHPLLHAKSWIRFPIGLAYGLGTAVTGAGIAVAGCAADRAADASGHLCGPAIAGGLEVMAASKDVTSYALQPDLRHWRAVPEAFFVTSSEDYTTDPCYRDLPLELQAYLIELL